MKTLKTGVIICGGGLIGSLTAYALNQLGIQSIVLEKNCAPSQSFDDDLKDYRAISLNPTSQKFLENLGLWKFLSPYTNPLHHIITLNNSREVVEFNNKDLSTPLGYMIEGEILKNILLQKATQNEYVDWQWNTVPEAFEKQDSYIEVILREGRRIQGDLLIGAEGQQSAVAKFGNFRNRQWWYPQKAMVCTYQHENHESMTNCAYENFLPDGPLALLPLNENHLSIVWTMGEDQADRRMNMSNTEFDSECVGYINETLMAGGKMAGQNVMKIPLFKRVTKRKCYALQGQFLPNFVSSRLVLVGDAAHVIHPLAGQGLNLGIQDIQELTKNLEKESSLGLDLGHISSLKKYEFNRRKDHIKMILATHGLNALFSNESKTLNTLRGQGLQWVNKSIGLKKLFQHLLT